MTNMCVLCVISGIDYKTTTILLDGRRVKLELWSAFLRVIMQHQVSYAVMSTTECWPTCVCLCVFHRDTSGQGRFCTIFRSYSRGAQVSRLVESFAHQLCHCLYVWLSLYREFCLCMISLMAGRLMALTAGSGKLTR